MKGRYSVLLAAALLVTGCTVPVSGTPSPAAGRSWAVNPCSLLTDAEATQLGLQTPGTPKPAAPQYRTPPSCLWAPASPDAAYEGSLQAFYATDQAIDRYYTTKSTVRVQLGGLVWDRYPSTVGDFICDLAVRLSNSSFVALSSQDLADTAKACSVAQAAAPVVARHLPK